jgi:hypothetical protein
VLELAAGGEGSRARGLARGLGRVAFVDGLGFGVFFAAFEGAKVPRSAHLRLRRSPAALAQAQRLLEFDRPGGRAAR